KDLGKPAAPAISLADVLDTGTLFAQTRFNGDGIVPADAAQDEAVRKVVEDMIACLGAKTDRSGKPGIDEEKLTAFFAEAGALQEWAAKFDADAGLRPLGEATPAAADARRAVRGKIDDYFARCGLAAFDAASLVALNRAEEDYRAVSAKDLSATAQEVAGFPIARTEADRTLPLAHGVNPAWSGPLAMFRAVVVAPMLGREKTSLSAAEWAAIGSAFAPFEAWLAAKPATSVEKLGLARIREILAGPSRVEIAKLLGQDKSLEREFEAIAQVERLVR